jgi:hypothetical protein
MSQLYRAASGSAAAWPRNSRSADATLPDIVSTIGAYRLSSLLALSCLVLAPTGVTRTVCCFWAARAPVLLLRLHQAVLVPKHTHIPWVSADMDQAHPGRLQNAQRRPKGTTASVSASSLGLSGTFQLEAAGAVAAAADRRFSRPSGHPLLQICVCCAGSACLGCFSGGISTSGIAAGAAAQPVATRYVHKQSAVACDLSAFSDRLLVITARTGIEGIRDGSKMLSGNHSGQPQHAVSRVARLSQAAAQADITVATISLAGRRSGDAHRHPVCFHIRRVPAAWSCVRGREHGLGCSDVLLSACLTVLAGPEAVVWAVLTRNC